MQQVEDLERIFCETKIFRKNKNQQQTNEQKKNHQKNLHKLSGARGLRAAARFGSVDGILNEVAITEQDSLRQ